tara:strand:+ start:665 stop:1420 length:756 start_codon:yes stop_codon:yes gene_type:complete
MNYRILIIIFLFLYSCETNIVNNKKIENIIPVETFSNKGFALVFNDDLKKKKLVNKKIDERSLIIFQKNLKKNTKVKITSLINNKSILAKVGNNSKYPNFYNSVISKRIFDELGLSEIEPYVEITTISENSTFLAKEADMYEEEKNVAEKVPVEGVSISDLSLDKKKVEDKQKKSEFSYIIKIADFYYLDTAKLMQKRIIDELSIDNSSIIKISNTNFRVYLGPFNNLKSLKNAYDDITPLNFENIEIVKL